MGVELRAVLRGVGVSGLMRMIVFGFGESVWIAKRVVAKVVTWE